MYLRTGNPTCEEAECLVQQLEGGAGSLTFSSGMAAITTAICTVVQAGDHVVNNSVFSSRNAFWCQYWDSESDNFSYSTPKMK